MTEPPSDELRYQPGVCNIGTGERHRRRLFGQIGIALGVIYVVVVLAVDAAAWIALGSAVLFALGAVGYLQARMGFCAYYGLTGQYNLGPISAEPEVVGESEARTTDRRRAIRIGAYSVVIGAVLGALGYLLALSV